MNFKQNISRLVSIVCILSMIMGMSVNAADESQQAGGLSEGAGLEVGDTLIISGGVVASEFPDGVNYDADTNTLTLTNYKSSEGGIWFYDVKDLTIRLEGENSVVGRVGAAFEDYTIEGPGSLTITASHYDEEENNVWGVLEAITYGQNLTIRDCTINIIKAEEDAQAGFWGISKMAWNGGGETVIENSNIHIQSVIPEDTKEGYNVGIDAQEGNLTINNSTIDIDLTGGIIYGLGVGLMDEEGSHGGNFTLNNSTIKCVTQAKKSGRTMYFYNINNPEKNYYYAGKETPNEQMAFDKAFKTEASYNNRYVGAYNCILISPTAISELCDHQWDEGVITAQADCKNAGVKTITCKLCGETKTETVAALGHQYGDWKVLKEAGCTEDGVKTRTCERCGETENVSIPQLGHDISTKIIKEATCTEAGEKQESCSRCDYKATETIAATGHDYEWTVEKEATFHEDGVKKGICRKCGDAITERIPKRSESHTHDFNGKEEVTKAATCLAEGAKKVYCTEPECGEYIIKSIPVAAHSVGDWVIIKDATCSEEGLKQRSCSVCGQVTETEPIAKLAHTYEKWETLKEATCTEPGVETAECVVCGEKTVRGTNVLGHNFAEWEVKKKATCTEDGEEISVCTRCGEKSSRTVKAAGHKLGEWTIIKKATKSEDGEKEAVCSVCGERITKKISKLSDVQPMPQANKKAVTSAQDSVKSEIPKTGDSAQPVQLIIMMTAAAGMIAALAVRKIRRK